MIPKNSAIILLLIVTSVMKIKCETLSKERNNTEKLFFKTSSKDLNLKTNGNTSSTTRDKQEHSNHLNTKTFAWYNYLRTNETRHNDKSGRKEAKLKLKDKLLKFRQFKRTSNFGLIPDPQFKCPEDQAIEPCTCSITNKMLNCSAVKSFVKLKQILNTADFPSKKFVKFTYYSHTSNNKEEATLLNDTFGPLSFNDIFIGDSGLKEIEPHAFSGSEDTLSNFLSDNNIHMIKFPFQVLDNYKNLTTVSMNKGSLEEIPALTSTTLTYLNLNTNRISSIANNAFQNVKLLQVVDLSYNSLEKMKGWSIGSNVFIYVNHNNITETTAFTNFQPRILDQSYNYLTTFNEDVYEPILKKEYLVDVTSNNIECSDMKWATNNPLYNPYLISDCSEQ